MSLLSRIGSALGVSKGIEGQYLSRSEAKSGGLTRYFTGKPCKRGHVAERIASTGYCVACSLDRRARWRDENRDKINAQARAMRAADPEKYRARDHDWRDNPRSKAIKARIQRDRRARKKASGGRHSLSDVMEILTLQNGRCAYCRKVTAKRYEVDHITPIALGGTNDRQNIQILCPGCNRRKRSKEPHRFARELGMLL